MPDTALGYHEIRPAYGVGEAVFAHAAARPAPPASGQQNAAPKCRIFYCVAVEDILRGSCEVVPWGFTSQAQWADAHNALTRWFARGRGVQVGFEVIHML